MLEIALAVELGSPAQRVWEVTGNFNGLPDWHPWVESSVLEPAGGGVGRRIVNVGGDAGGEARCALEYRAIFAAAPGATEHQARERIRSFYEAGLANLPRLFGA